MINDLHGKRVKYFNDEDKCYLDEAHFRDYLNDWLPIFYRQFAARK